jgi:hypothetical protein
MLLVMECLYPKSGQCKDTLGTAEATRVGGIQIRLVVDCRYPGSGQYKDTLGTAEATIVGGI